MPATYIRPLTYLGLLIPLLAFSLVYVSSAGWQPQVLGFFGAVDLCAILATAAGLELRRGIGTRRLAAPVASAIVAAVLVLCSAWFVPFYADRYQEQIQVTEADYPTPDLHFTDLTGKQVNLRQLRGKVVVLDFWATWCGPCLHEMPALDAMAKHYAGTPAVVVYAIAANEDKTADVVSAFLKDNHYYDLDVVYDTDGKAAAAFHAFTFPTLVIIDAKGTVRYKHNGFNTDASPFEAITAKIESLRAEK